MLSKINIADLFSSWKDNISSLSFFQSKNTSTSYDLSKTLSPKPTTRKRSRSRLISDPPVHQPLFNNRKVFFSFNFNQDAMKSNNVVTNFVKGISRALETVLNKNKNTPSEDNPVKRAIEE